MLKVTQEAAAVLKAAKEAQGAPDEAGVRIRKATEMERRDNRGVDVALSIASTPEPGDAKIEQDGLPIYLENTLVDPLEGRTLDVREQGEQTVLVFR